MKIGSCWSLSFLSGGRRKINKIVDAKIQVSTGISASIFDVSITPLPDLPDNASIIPLSTLQHNTTPKVLKVKEFNRDQSNFIFPNGFGLGKAVKTPATQPAPNPLMVSGLFTSHRPFVPTQQSSETTITLEHKVKACFQKEPGLCSNPIDKIKHLSKMKTEFIGSLKISDTNFNDNLLNSVFGKFAKIAQNTYLPKEAKFSSKEDTIVSLFLDYVDEKNKADSNNAPRSYKEDLPSSPHVFNPRLSQLSHHRIISM